MTAEGKNLSAAGVEPRWLDGQSHWGITARAFIPDFPAEHVIKCGFICIQGEVAWTQGEVRFAVLAELLR